MRNGFSEDSAFKFFVQTCSAVHFLQRNNLVHRDLKPENLLLDENNNIKLSDFGWCDDDLNLSNQTCGTYEYMAPEIIMNKNYNKKVDNWALGVLLYELLHGQTPFHLQDLYKDKSKVKLIFLSCGSKERPDGIKSATSALKVAGINAVSFISENTAHEFLTWRRSLLELAPLLFKD